MLKFLINRGESEKIFCIGLNKTGTTTLKKTMSDFGYKIGNQRKGELLIHAYASRNFKPIVKLARSAEFFQDAPFSFPHTFEILAYSFPNAKFILTVRDSPEQWYNSLTKFHGKRFGENGRIPPSADDLKNANYLGKGMPYKIHKILYDTPDGSLYNQEYLLEYYNRHIINVKDFFRHNAHKLLTINVAVIEDYFRLCDFLGKEPIHNGFPWHNKT